MNGYVLIEILENWDMIVFIPFFTLFGFYFFKTIKEIISDNKNKYNVDWDKRRHLELISRKIRGLDGFEFEEFMTYLFQKLGYRALNTGKTRDGGKDIILQKDGNTIYVECKKYGVNSHVGVDIVKKLYATMLMDGVKEGVIVTTGDYTSTALTTLRDCSRQGVLIRKWGFNDIMKSCATLNTVDILVWLGEDMNVIEELKSEIC